jgi:hypothetical protein
MEYIISCISHNRHENIKNFLDKVGTNDVIFFVKDQNDKDLYLQNGATNVIASGSLMQSRNASLEYCFNQNKICIQLSDDIENIMVNDYTGKRTHEYVNVKKVIEDIMPNFLQSEYKFAGFPPTNNPFFATNEHEFNKFIVGDFILIKPTPLRFDMELRLKEDYDFTLQNLKHYGGCIRYGKYLCSFKHYSNKGGAVDYRTSDLEQKTIKYLINKWGECIKLNTKRINEILINKKSLEIINSKQSSLF